MKKIKHILSAILMTSLFLSCSKQPSNTVWPGETWERSTPEAQGVDSGELLEAIKVMELPESGVESMVIIRNGFIIAEFYREPFDSTTPHRINSCTKSFTSALIGIAIDEGLIKNENQPVLPFFDEVENVDPKAAEITIKDLLTMQSGFEWKNNVPFFEQNDERLYQLQMNPIEYVLSKPVIDTPGTVFHYNSMNSQLLAYIIHRESGMQSGKYLQEKLLDPIGIKSENWNVTRENSIYGGTSVSMPTEELARLGYLYLNEGIWDGNRIISRRWTNKSVSPLAETNPNSPPDSRRYVMPNYGYQWWVYNENEFMAQGGNGQFCFVNKEKNIVVAINSAFMSPQYKEQIFLIAHLSNINMSHSPLPENKEDLSSLQDYLVSSGKAPKIRPYRDQEGLRQKLENKVIRFEENDMNLLTLRYSFADGNLITKTLSRPPSTIDEIDYKGISVYHLGKEYEETYGHLKVPYYGRVTGLNTFSISYESIYPGQRKAKYTYTLDIDGQDVLFTRYTHPYGMKQERTETARGRLTAEQ